MLKLYSCIVNQHDLKLVLLAAIICGLASFTTVAVLHHARGTDGQMRRVWLVTAAVTGGSGIWATHFVAMLAFSPSIPTAYDFGLTLVSLGGAIVLSGAGFAIAASTSNWWCPLVGGAIVGGGIAIMHYVGMAAYEVEGRIVWDPTLVATSIVVGEVLGAIALHVAMHGSTRKFRNYGAGLLTAAICTHHFTAMSAVSIFPDRGIALFPSAVATNWLAVAVAFMSLAIIFFAFGGLAIDIRDRRRSELEAQRMLGLANAAFEGLVLCKEGRIAIANSSFLALVGASDREVNGKRLREYCSEEPMFTQLCAQSNRALETDLVRADGIMIPVELISRYVDFAGEAYQAVAVRDLSLRKQNEERIQFLAHHDSLTGLPNRGTFDMRLDQKLKEAVGSERRVALLCLDLDHFKDINDTFGHATGDRALQAFVERTRGVLHSDQIFARIGGDEFAIVVSNISDPRTAGQIAENILSASSSELKEVVGSLKMTASIGIAVYPDDASDRELLIAYADTAMHRAKSERRGTYRFFEPAMDEEVQTRRLIEHELRYAATRGELRLLYQPQKDIAANKVVGFEALVRWRNGTHGEISPGEFIPVAEECGAILEIGEWVLRTACNEAAGWKQPLIVAVNVSAVQLHNEEFPRQVHEILLQSGLAAQRLELEVTETALIRDFNRALASMRQIKALGVRIAMDDFGTGYSSLSNLRAFPYDKIKIDRGFVSSVDTNEHAAAIVRAVLSLGRSLGLPVLAEGVETPGELDFLIKEGCSEIQGYLLGRPATIDKFSDLTNENGSCENSPAVVIPPHIGLSVVGA